MIGPFESFESTEKVPVKSVAYPFTAGVLGDKVTVSPFAQTRVGVVIGSEAFKVTVIVSPTLTRWNGLVESKHTSTRGMIWGIVT